jgi:hypothetical protein
MSHAMPSRRNVVRSAAWAVPVVAASVGAPAFAASCGSTTYAYRLNWVTGTASYTRVITGTGANRTMTGTATVSGPAGSTPVTVTFVNTVVGTDNRDSTNLTVPNVTDIGNLGAAERGLRLYNNNVTSGRDASRQVTRVIFSRPVTNLRFTITDIDSTAGQWYDQLELSGTRTGTSTARDGQENNPPYGAGPFLLGSGTAADPWRMHRDDHGADETNDDDGNLAVAYSGSVPEFEMTYWSSSGSGEQYIFLSDFTFSAAGC